MEDLAALGACAIVAVLASRSLLDPGVFEGDAFVHQYWMAQFRDAQLFTDPLTADLRASARYPEGYVGLFWLASRLADPIAVGEWLGVALMAVSGWLVYRIVREHTACRPAAWIAAALFLAVIDIHRFAGGFPRAFVHPVVLLTALLAIRGRELGAALAAAGGALLYPPAALLAVGTLLASSLRWAGRRPALERRRLGFALAALALAALAIGIPRLAAGGSPAVLGAAEARTYPEFGAQGALHFFVPSAAEYLRQNRSGFDLRGSGSVLALAAVALLLVRRSNLRLLRGEVLALPVVALGGWAVAQAVLFKLYMPHRYTYPLVAFFAIAIAVALEPTWTAALARPRRRLLTVALLAAPVALAPFAVSGFPLGPREPLGHFASWTTVAIAAATVALAGAVVLALRRGSRAALGAALTGLALLAAVLVSTADWTRGSSCFQGRVTRYLSELPKDAIVAGDPIDMRCLPGTARRAVVISTQLAPSYEREYFLRGRERMFDSLRAYYGASIQAIADLRLRYGATHLWVRERAVRREAGRGGFRWPRQGRPYAGFVAGLLATAEPAVLRLPATCRRFAHASDAVYDIGCLAASGPP